MVDDKVWRPPSVPGIACGIVYNRTGKVTAAAVTHALIDVVRGLGF